jgi:hypothetical protein
MSPVAPPRLLLPAYDASRSKQQSRAHYTDEYDGLESRDVSLRTKCAHPVLEMPTLGEIRTPQPVDAKLKFSPYDSQQSDSWQT